jgi:hypothetical protein
VVYTVSSIQSSPSSSPSRPATPPAIEPRSNSNSNSRLRLKQLVQSVPTLDQDPQTTQHSSKVADAPGDGGGSGRLGVVDEAEQDAGGKVG